MKTQPRLRERKKARTREAILEAATRLYLHRGYDATTVEQVADVAGVARRTFFRYFPRKDDTVFPNQDERLALFRSRLTEHRSTNAPYRAVVLACIELAQVFEQARAELTDQYAIVRASAALIARQTEYDVHWEHAIFATLLPSATPAPAEVRHARVFAGAVMGMVRATLDAWVASPSGPGLQAVGREALIWIEQGYAASLATLPREPTAA